MNDKSSIRVAIGMSGGIDSCVAAHLLKEQGYNVTGFTIKMWDNGSRCCDLEETARAQQFAHKIGIPHYILDLRKEFRKLVVDYFIDAYMKGLTPNPCVVCNQEIKFSFLFEKKHLMDFDFIATGHYAKIREQDNLFFLSRAKDQKKSQEYFLARVNKKNLSRIMFPLGNLNKSEVKELAGKIDFKFRSSESQEVCFVKPGLKYHEFILQFLKDNKISRKGLSAVIVDRNNIKLGDTDCYFKFTTGQRGGLGISDRTPYYVVKVDAENHKIIVGKKEDVLMDSFLIKNVYWYTDDPVRDVYIKIRYNHKGEKAFLEEKNGGTVAKFLTPQLAVTPGQLAVFYVEDIVVGSGWVEDIL